MQTIHAYRGGRFQFINDHIAGGVIGRFPPRLQLVFLFDVVQFSFKMKRAHLLVLILLALSTCWAKSEEIPLNATNWQALADKLTQKLDALGSFQAEYRVIGPHKLHANITVLFNNYQKYCLTTFGKDKPDFYFVTDFSQANDASGNVEMLLISGKKGKTTKMSPKYLMTHLDNPVGVFSSILKAFGPEIKVTRINGDFSASGPTLSLSLSSDSITIAGGYSSQSTNLMLSWLDPDMISNAVDVAENADSIQFSYPGNHIISVDRKTGFLLKDAFPPDIREITLENYSALQNPGPYSALIPRFDKIKFKALPAKEIRDNMYNAFFTFYGRQFAAMGNFDQILQTNSARIADCARETGRRMLDENATAIGYEKLVVKLRKEEISEYKDFLRRPPMDVIDLSYTNFLDRTITLFQTNSSEIEVPAHVRFLGQEDAKLLIEKFPKDAQAPLFKLYDIFLPPLAQGAASELVVVGCTDAKKMGEPPDLVPAKANAYYQRGCIKQKKGDLPGAKYDFEKALELKPGDPAIKQKLLEVSVQ
jgi:hypothetical protein